MIEDISHKVCSCVGMQKLGKLIAVYDDNGVSIDGQVTGWCHDDSAEGFEASSCHLLAQIDGHDSEAIGAALAATTTDQPAVILARTIIGFGAPKQGTQAIQGEAMGPAELGATHKTLGSSAARFGIPADIRPAWDWQVAPPCTHVFDARDAAYEESVLPAAVTRPVVVEAGAGAGGWKYVQGEIVGIDHRGPSASAEDLFLNLEFTHDTVVAAIDKALTNQALN